MRKIAVFDLDGTVNTGTWTFDIAKALVRKFNLASEQQSIDEATRVAKSRETTEAYWTYNETMLEIFERILPGVTPAQFKDVVAEVLHERSSFCFAYTTSLIKTMREEGRALIAISGSIKDIAEPFARPLGFDIVVASELAMEDGKYTGKRVALTRSNKHVLLQKIVDEHGLTLEDSVGVGDTHRDISLLEAVEHPIAFNPNIALYDEAAKRGWKIVIERKNVIYELTKNGDKYLLENAHPIRNDNNKEYLR